MQKSFLQKYRYYKYLLLIFPGLVVWFILAIYPNLEVFPLSLYRWNGISKVKTYTGLQNIITIISAPYFRQVLLNTLLYVLFLLTIQSAVAIFISMVLKKNTVHNKLFRTLFFIPLVFSSVMVGFTWGYMYDPNLGVLNQLLVVLGLSSFNGFNWLGEPVRAILCIVLVHIWANIGYPVTIITAGLQTIPEALYEAAEVEGTNAVQVFIYVTFPLLLPTLLRVTLLTIATGAMAFDYVLLLGSTTVDSPFDTWSVIIYKSMAGNNIYNPGNNNLGLSAANGVMLGIILFAVFLIQYVVTRKVEESVN